MGAELSKVLAVLDRHRKLFDLTRDNLGRDLCKAATDGVQATIAAEQSPDGVPWAPLSEKYEEFKQFQYPGQPIAVLHGIMADPHEVAGIVSVANSWAEVTYGRSEQAREEAHWFQEGNGRQPARPFWGFTAQSLKQAGEILDARFKTL